MVCSPDALESIASLMTWIWPWENIWPFQFLALNLFFNPVLLCPADCLPSAAGSQNSDFDPGLERSPGGGNGNPVQYPCLENPVDTGAWWAAVHGVAKSGPWLSNLASREAWVLLGNVTEQDPMGPSLHLPLVYRKFWPPRPSSRSKEYI